jgi:hypothetical protein
MVENLRDSHEPVKDRDFVFTRQNSVTRPVACTCLLRFSSNSVSYKRQY